LEVALHMVELPMREPWVTSYGVDTSKHAIIVEVRTERGAVGFAECVAGHAPHYTEETTKTAWQVLRDWLIPRCVGGEFLELSDLVAWASSLDDVRGNRMAKAGLEMALWDAFAAETDTPLPVLLAADKSEVPVGISIGIQPTVEHLVNKVGGYIEQGFQRIKLKIEPGRDKAFVRAVRAAFPALPLMVDANSAYASASSDSLRWLDDYELSMIEQPLAYDDMVDHAQLQVLLKTPICLDESIRSAEDVRRANSIHACRFVNVKPGRVGGFAEVQRIHRESLRSGIALWCGGMLETGIGRLHNIALSGLGSFTWPGDTAPSERYFAQDIIEPPVSFTRPGWLAVEPLCGVASRVVRSRLEACTTQLDVVTS
jgi:O-succinylbenzoate synthase